MKITSSQEAALGADARARFPRTRARHAYVTLYGSSSRYGPQKPDQRPYTAASTTEQLTVLAGVWYVPARSAAYLSLIHI